MAVGNPCRVWSPAPATSQSLWGSPDAVFSQAITLTTGGPQGLAAAAPPALVTRGNATPKRVNASRLAPAFSPERILPFCMVLALMVTSIPPMRVDVALWTRGPGADPHLFGGNRALNAAVAHVDVPTVLRLDSPCLVKAILNPWPRGCILGNPGDMC